METCPYCGQSNTHKDENGYCKKYNCYEQRNEGIKRYKAYIINSLIKRTKNYTNYERIK